jgi:AcrR family transcriptional regulator
MTTVRRTQAERRAATQATLLDATLHCLVDLGHAGTTTTAICQRAGVSQGALFRHWDTKADLLSDAVSVLYGRLFDTYRARLDEVADADDRIGAGVRALWELFQRPDLLAALELYVAARTDADLRAAMVRLEAPHEERTLALAEELFLPDGVDDSQRALFRLGVSLIVDALQGAAIRSIALEDRGAIDAELDLLTDLARGVLAPFTTDGDD